MSKEQLKHIFEQSPCLTQRQLKNYVSGKMVHEEAHAVESHLLSCPFCTDAVEGLMEGKVQGAINNIDKLDSSFIAKHFGVEAKEIKSAAPPPVIKAGSYSTQPEKTEKKTISIHWKPMAAAAGLIAVACIAWFMRDNIFPHAEDQLAQQTTIEETPPQQELTYSATTDTQPIVQDTTSMIAVTEPAEQPVMPASTPAAEDAKDAKSLLARKEAEKKLPPATDAAKKAEASKTIAATSQGSMVVTDSKPAAAPTNNNAPATRMGNSFTGPEVPKYDEAEVAETKTEVVAKRKVNISKRASTGLDRADEFYNSGKYRKALKIYQDEMYDSKSNKKDAATLMAAQCHIGMGQEAQAKTLLNTLVNKNSIKKQQAQQLLTQMGE